MQAHVDVANATPSPMTADLPPAADNVAREALGALVEASADITQRFPRLGAQLDAQRIAAMGYVRVNAGGTLRHQWPKVRGKARVKALKRQRHELRNRERRQHASSH